MKIIVLGSNGMLGRYVYSYFKQKEYNVIGITRKELDVLHLKEEELKYKLLNIGLENGDVIINCIGMIKQRTDINDINFIYINSIFPRLLSNVCEELNVKMIHPTTDCFLPNTKVLTNNGYINIQDLNIDDNVYTHNGELKKVTDFLLKNVKENIYTIKTLGNDTVRCTNNHPWFAIKRKNREKFDFNNIQWIKTEDLEEGNLIAIPKLKLSEQSIFQIDLFNYSNEYKNINDEYNIFLNNIKDKNINIKKYCNLNNLNYRKIIKWNKNRNIVPKICKLNNILEINENISWFLGLFLAEGWVDNKKGRKTITITLGNEPELLNKLISIISNDLKIKYFIRYHKTQKGCQITFTHQLLSEMISKDFYINKEHYSHTKKIPNWVNNIGYSNIVSFINGYFKGDGCFYENKKTSFVSMVSVSEILIDDLKVLFMKIGILPSKSIRINNSESIICKRKVKIKNSYTLTINGNQLEKVINILNINSKYFNTKNRYNKFFENNNYWFVPITEIQEEYYDGLVYNIEVEDNHSYLVNGGLSAHNCVFDGLNGNYDENDLHNATDVYGKTKSLGEPNNCNVIRTSIIGEEVNQKRSLVEWVKSNKDKTIKGYTNHFWNGVTCLQFAKICEEIIENNLYWNGVKHIYTPISVSKYELVSIINDVFDLNITIEPFETEIKCDRTLNSLYNVSFDIPDLHEQIEEMKKFNINNGN